MSSHDKKRKIDEILKSSNNAPINTGKRDVRDTVRLDNPTPRKLYKTAQKDEAKTGGLELTYKLPGGEKGEFVTTLKPNFHQRKDEGQSWQQYYFTGGPKSTKYTNLIPSDTDKDPDVFLSNVSSSLKTLNNKDSSRRLESREQTVTSNDGKKSSIKQFRTEDMFTSTLLTHGESLSTGEPLIGLGIKSRLLGTYYKRKTRKELKKKDRGLDLFRDLSSKYPQLESGGLDQFEDIRKKSRKQAARDIVSLDDTIKDRFDHKYERNKRKKLGNKFWKTHKNEIKDIEEQRNKKTTKRKREGDEDLDKLRTEYVGHKKRKYF